MKENKNIEPVTVIDPHAAEIRLHNALTDYSIGDEVTIIIGIYKNRKGIIKNIESNTEYGFIYEVEIKTATQPLRVYMQTANIVKPRKFFGMPR